MEAAHQLAQAGVHHLVALHRVEPGETLADHHHLEVAFLSTVVHVALVEHLQMLGLQRLQGRADTLAHVHWKYLPKSTAGDFAPRGRPTQPAGTCGYCRRGAEWGAEPGTDAPA